ncbi:Unconventional Myosin-Ia [Manis pentadactyla]|nr:Unconventional Myosin-Ia [Manis pentadactyla]
MLHPLSARRSVWSLHVIPTDVFPQANASKRTVKALKRPGIQCSEKVTCEELVLRGSYWPLCVPPDALREEQQFGGDVRGARCRWV